MLSTESTFEFARPHRVRLVEPADPNQLREGTAILVAAYSDGGDFLQALSEDERTISVPTRWAAALGCDVVLEVRWPGLANRVYMRASVNAHNGDAALWVRPHRDEGSKLAFLIGAARGSFRWIRARRHRRYCVRLPLEWRPFGTTDLRDGVAEDLSVGGMLVVARSAPVYIGDEIVIRLHAGAAAQDLVLTGGVRHIEERAGDELAIGMKFARRSTAERRDLRRLLRAFAARGIVLLDPWV